MVIKVSLWGPHSLETSTLLPTLVAVVVAGALSEPLSLMNSYLLHQVGSWAVFSAETFGGGDETETANNSKANTRRSASLEVSFIKNLLWMRKKNLLGSESRRRIAYELWS